MAAIRPDRESSAKADIFLEISELRIEAATPHSGSVGVVAGVDLIVHRGEAVALVGESGSGKSLTARAITRTLPPGLKAWGSVLYDDVNLLSMTEKEMRKHRGRDVGLVLQDPFTMLNPLIRVGSHIEETIAVHSPKMPKADRRSETARRLADVGLADPQLATRFPFQLSGGQLQRAAIAAALAGDPRILIADEPSTALDVRTQSEILKLLKRLQQQRGMGLILITHDLRVASALCDRIYVLYAGSVVEAGPIDQVRRAPLHPYTVSLYLSEPPLDGRVGELPRLEGRVPRPEERVPDQCVFAPRCPWVVESCLESAPPLATVRPGRKAACLRLPDIEPQLRRKAAGLDHFVRQGKLNVAEPLVEIRGLSKSYFNNGTEVAALNDVSLEVASGEAVGLLGESGSGKTTLARCLIGLEHPTKGTIAIDGVEGRDRRKLAQVVFQDPYSSLNPARTIGATLKEALLLSGVAKRAIEERVRLLIAQVEISEGYLSKYPSALSGGERQRVAIARALAARPRLMICDEPVSALDVSVQAQILNLLRGLHEEQGIAYLFVTHDFAVARYVTDRAYVLFQGKIVEAGPTGDLVDNPQHPYTRALVAAIPRDGWLALERAAASARAGTS